MCNEVTVFGGAAARQGEGGTGRLSWCGWFANERMERGELARQYANNTGVSVLEAVGTLEACLFWAAALQHVILVAVRPAVNIPSVVEHAWLLATRGWRRGES
eukprot:365804-Chlamydomonas_euryale.AAC.3